MNGFLEGIIINITTSLLYDIAKKAFLHDEGIKHFEKTVSETIIYFQKQGIELTKEYFCKFLEDSDVINSSEYFHEGIDYISKEVLINSFLKTDFYFPTNRDRKLIAIQVINYFVRQITNNILQDPKTNALYLKSIIEINFRRNNLFTKEFKKNVKIISTELNQIQENLIRISRNQEIMLEIQVEESNRLKNIENMITSFVKEKDGSLQIKSEFQNLLNNANDLFEKELYDTAREKYLDILKSDNLTNEQIWKLNRNIGMTFLITNEIEKAIPYLKNAYTVLPNEYRGKLQNIFVIMLEQGEQAAYDKFISDFGEKDLDYDERLMKMNLLIKLGKLEDALQLYDKKSLENPDNRFAYSKILYEKKDYKNAIAEIEKVLETKSTPELNYEYGVYRIAYIIEKISKEKFLANRILSEIKEYLLETKRIFNDAILKLEKTQNKLIYRSAIFNRGVVNGYLKLDDESRADFNTAEILGLSNIEIFTNLGISYVLINNFTKAIYYFKKAYDLDKQKSLINLLNALFYGKEFIELKKLCLEHISYPEIKLNSNNIKIYSFLANALNRELDKEGSDNILFEINASFPNDYDFILTKTKILWERGEKEEAIKFIESKKDITDSNKEIIYLKLADYYFSNSQWIEAKEIYKNYLDIDETITINYLNCLYNLKKDEDVIIVAKKMLDDNNIENKDKIKELLGYSYLGLENYVDALPIFRELSIRKRISFYYYNWAYCEIRLTNYSEALKITKEAEKEFSGKYKELSKISVNYLQIGEKKKAFDIAYLCAINLPEDAEINANFASIIHFMINEPELVSEEGKILYNHLMQNWDVLFPEYKLFEKIIIEPDLKTIREKLEKRSDFGLRIMSMYERKQIPLSYYSNQRGENIYESWKNLSISYMSKIYSYNPNTRKKQYEIIKSSKKIVIEPFAFFTLYELKLHQFLNNVCLPQGLLDSLVQYNQELSLASVQGRNSIISFEGNLIKLEVPAEDIRKEIIKIEDMINFVKQHIQGTNKLFIDKRIAIMLEKSSVQAINISLELDIPIICDDSLLNDLMQNNIPDYKYSSTLFLIQHLYDKRIINDYRFNELILKLIWMNYYFVPVNARILLHNIESQDFKNYNINKKAIDTLRDINQLRELNIMVVSDFIVQIYFLKAMTEFNKNNWVDYILNAVTVNDSDTKSTLIQIENKIYSHIDHLFSTKAIKLEIKQSFIKWIDKIIKYRNSY